jgi:hypothetical protein
MILMKKNYLFKGLDKIKKSSYIIIKKLKKGRIKMKKLLFHWLFIIAIVGLLFSCSQQYNCCKDNKELIKNTQEQNKLIEEKIKTGEVDKLLKQQIEREKFFIYIFIVFLIITILFYALGQYNEKYEIFLWISFFTGTITLILFVKTLIVIFDIYTYHVAPDLYKMEFLNGLISQ